MATDPETRDFIFVANVCTAVVKALNSTVQGEVFQIGTGMETSILQLASRIQQLAGKHVAIQHSNPRRGDIQQNYSTITKAAAQLEWKPQVNLNEGLRLTLAWFRDRHTVTRPSTSAAQSKSRLS